MRTIPAVTLAILALPFFACADDVSTEAAIAAAKATAEAADRPPMHPRDDFLKSADVRGIELSPDGAWLSFHRDTGSALSLFIRNVDNGREHRVVADSEGVDAHWAGDGERLWLGHQDGLGVHDTTTRTGRRVFRFDERRQQRFFGLDARAVHHVVVSEKVAVDGEWRYRYLGVNADGEITSALETRKALLDVLLDENGMVRYAAGYDGDKFDTVTWRISGEAREELMRCPLPERCQPVAFRSDEGIETLWSLAHDGGDLKSLQRWSASDREWTMLHRDPRGISGARSVIFNSDQTDWLALAYRPDHVAWHANDTREGQVVSEAIAFLARALPGANLDFTIADAGRRWLVRAARANWQHDRYFVFDQPARELNELFAAQRRGRIPHGELAEVLPVRWRAEDGFKLHGYVFLPMGVDLGTAPLIAQIHGGPYANSSGESDPATQLLTNRGYIVFKPNFRASTGYGVEYVKASAGRFGREGVLDDILSGMDYLLENGIGDPERQAVIGHSFGGYASLMAVTHHPQRFAFAVPSAAPVDMAWTMQDIAIEGGSALSEDGPPLEVLFSGYSVPYGDPEWHARMRRDSPMENAGDLEIPVYLWAGARDDRVAVESLVRYVAEAGPGARPLFLIDPESGHSPRQRLNSEALAWLIEFAANEHFGGGLTPPSPRLQQFLDRNLRGGMGDRSPGTEAAHRSAASGR